MPMLGELSPDKSKSLLHVWFRAHVMVYVGLKEDEIAQKNKQKFREESQHLGRAKRETGWPLEETP